MEDIQEYRDTIALNKRQHFEYAVDNVIHKDGLYLEFGVFEGRSISMLGNLIYPSKIYGFDSFEGLPEDWIRGNDDVYHKGHFNLRGQLPEVPENVELVKGFFENTLEPWLNNHTQTIAMLHIDSDLYSSAKYILNKLNHLIFPGTIIIFDELCDWKNSGIYRAWEDGEWKALNEWLIEKHRKVSALARGENFESTLRVII